MDVSAWHCSYFSRVLTSQPTEELILHRFIFSFLCAPSRHLSFLQFFFLQPSDLLTVDLCVSQALCYSSLKFLPSLSLSLSLSQVLLAICWSVKLTDNAHEWWMMTGGLSGANGMHNTACRQRFLPSALNTCCSYCTISAEDLPTADNCDGLKWKPPKAASRHVCTYCVRSPTLCQGSFERVLGQNVSGQCQKQAGKIYVTVSSFLSNCGWKRLFFGNTDP